MRYQLVQNVDGEWITTTGDMENIFAAFEVRGFTPKGVETLACRRQELQGQPKFEGLAGPLYGGPGVIRYETWTAYDVLST